MSDIYKIEADVTQYQSAIDKLVATHKKLFNAEGAHVSKLQAMEGAEKKATLSISGITKAGNSFTKEFEAANGVLTATASKLDVLHQKGRKKVSASFAEGLLGQLDQKTLTTPQVLNIDKALGTLDELVSANKISKKQLETIWQDVQLGIGTKVEGELARVKSVLATINRLTSKKIAKPQAAREIESQAPGFVEANAKRLAAAKVLASKLEADTSTHLKKIEDLKKDSAKKLRDLDKARNKQVAAILKDKETGVRASNALIKKIEEKHTAAVIVIAKKKYTGTQSSLTKVEELVTRHNTKLLVLEERMQGELEAEKKKAVAAFQAVLKVEEKDWEASLKERLAENKKYHTAKKSQDDAARKKSKADAATTVEDTAVRSDTKLLDTLPLRKGVSAQGVLNYNDARDSLLKLLAVYRSGTEKQKAAVKQLDTVWKNVANGQIKSYGVEVDAIQKKIFALRKEHSLVNASAGHSYNAQIRQSHNLSGALDKQRAALVGLTISWQSMFRLVISQATSRALSAFIGQITEAKQEVLDLSTEFARITTLDDTNTPIDAWVEGVRKLNEESGLDILDQTRATYEALSNQIGEGAEALLFMKDANDLAIISGATAAQSQELLADAIHAWGLEVANTSSIAATFFKIVDLGRASVAEMAPNFGRVSIPAAQLGVSLEEVGAALATMTIKGVRLETASTLLRNVLLKLAKPSEALTKTMNGLGFYTGEAWIATRGLGGVLEDLESATKGSSTELANQLKNIRAITGATVFAGDGLRVYGENLAKISTASEDYADKVKDVADSVGLLYKKASAKISNLFTFDTLRPLIKDVSELTNGFDDFVVVAKKAKVVLAALAGATIPIMILGVTKLIGATVGLASALVINTHPIIAAGVVIASVMSGIAAVYYATNVSIEEENERFFGTWLEGYNTVRDKAKKVMAEIQVQHDKAFKRGVAPVRRMLAQIGAEYDKLAKINARSLKDFNVDVNKIRNVSLAAAQAILTTSKNKISEFRASIKSLEADARASIARIQSLSLTKELVGKTDIQKIVILNKEIAKNIALRQTAVDTGDLKSFNELTSKLGKLEATRQTLQLKVTADPTTLIKSFKDTYAKLERQAKTFEIAGDDSGLERVRKEYEEIQALATPRDFVKELNRAESQLQVAIQIGDTSDIDKAIAKITTLQEAQKTPATPLFIKVDEGNLIQRLTEIDAYLSQLRETANPQYAPLISQLKDEQKRLREVFQSAQTENIYGRSIVSEGVTDALRKQLLETTKELKTVEESAAKTQAEKIVEIQGLYKELTSFKVEDFNSTENINKSLERQIELTKQLVALQPGQDISGVSKTLAQQKGNYESFQEFSDVRSNIAALVLQSNSEQAAAQAAVKAAEAEKTKFVIAAGEFAKLTRAAAEVSALDRVADSLGIAKGPRRLARDAAEGTRVPESTRVTFSDSAEELNAASKAAFKFVEDSSAANLRSFTGMLEELRLKMPRMVAGETEDTRVRQVYKQLTSGNLIQQIVDATSAQETSKASLVKIQEARSAFEGKYPEVAAQISNTTALEKATSATERLGIAMEAFMQGVSSGSFNVDKVAPTRALPKVIPNSTNRIGAEKVSSTSITNNYDIQLTAPTEQLARQLAPEITRRQKYLAATA